MTEREHDEMSQLHAELVIERKKRELVEAQLQQLLALLLPLLDEAGEESRAEA